MASSKPKTNFSGAESNNEVSARCDAPLQVEETPTAENPLPVASGVEKWTAEATGQHYRGIPEWLISPADVQIIGRKSSIDRLLAAICASLSLAESRAMEAAGTDLIAAERQRQLSVEQWTSEHDDTEHANGSLAMAGACYAVMAKCLASGMPFDQASEIAYGHDDQNWPWGESWWKPARNPIRNLAKAGALIAAEIDRLLRKASSVSVATKSDSVSGIPKSGLLAEAERKLEEQKRSAVSS